MGCINLYLSCNSTQRKFKSFLQYSDNILVIALAIFRTTTQKENKVGQVELEFKCKLDLTETLS